MPWGSVQMFTSSYAALLQAKAEELNRVRQEEYDIEIRKIYGLSPKYSKPKVEVKDGNCTQCGAKSFRLISDHGNWKHICSYCGSDK